MKRNPLILTPLEGQVILSKKPFILFNGERRCGKTTAGCVWLLENLMKEQTVAWVIVPKLKMIEVMLEIIKDLSARGIVNPLKSINKRRYFETVFYPYYSAIYFITDRDLFDIFPIGRKPPDFLYLDNADCYSKTTLRKIHRKLNFIIKSRNGNPKILITYTFVRQRDRLQALWSATNGKETWEHILSPFLEKKINEV